MKIRNLLLLPLVASCFSLTSCNEQPKISLVYGQIIHDDVDEISYEDLKAKVEDKDTFMLAIQSTCSCWNTFQGVLQEYIKETHTKVYMVRYSSFFKEDGTALDNFGINITKGHTNFAVFNNGKLEINELSSTSDLKFQRLDKFKEYISGKVNLPTYFYISYDQLKQKYKDTNKTSLIYFSRGNCPDCTYVDANFLKLYGESHTNTKPMYIVDCETLGIRVYDETGWNLTPESQVQWTKFKDDYGLSNVNNPKYGFNTGYVPTFLLIKGNAEGQPTYLSGSVYVNDTLTQDGENYKVTSTYYTQERLPDLQYLANFTGTKVLTDLVVPEADTTVYKSWSHDAAAVYHNPLLNAFLDYALPLVD